MTLTGITVTDDMLGAIACPASMLLPGGSMTCTAGGTAAAGQYANLGTAIGTPTHPAGTPLGAPVTDEDPSHYYGLALAAVGDRVWLDSNGNGIQDAGESGIPGVTVNLWQGTAAAGTTTTGSLGDYGFSDLMPGEYTLEFIAPAGLVFSPQDQGTNDALDSDAAADGLTAAFTLGEGQIDTTRDAGLYAPARVGDRVWLDGNGNGLQDAGEPGIAEVTVNLWRDGSVVGTTATDAAGEYWFDGLRPGEYALEFVAPAGFVFTMPDQGDDAFDSDADPTTGITAPFTLLSGQEDPTRDAGLYEPAAVGDLVFEDLNADGLQDAGEPGVPGVLVTLFPTGRTALTDDTGRYWFDGLTPGEYSINFALPNAGWTFSPQDQGDDALDSDPDPATGTTAPFV